MSRCKAPHKTTRAMERSRRGREVPSPRTDGAGYAPKRTAEERSLAGRAAKLLGRAVASRRDADARASKLSGKGSLRPSPASKVKSPQSIVFEGRRASANDARSRIAKSRSRKLGVKKMSKPKY